MSKPRLVLEGKDWRVVLTYKEDQHGVERPHRVVERIDGHDALGGPVWREVKTTYNRAATSDLEYMMTEFLELLLQSQEK